MPEWVLMCHPSLSETNDAPPLVTREAFDEVWKKNGWKLYKPPPPKESKEIVHARSNR